MEDVLEIDTKNVQWPKTPAVKVAMRQEIRRLAKEGYRYFGTMTLRCLNGIESPGPDPSGPPGWECMDKFFPDCEPHQVSDESSVYNDVRLFARKIA
jgi:hypothetical protein